MMTRSMKRNLELERKLELETKICDLPYDLLANVLDRVDRRNHVSRVCWKWYELDRVLTRKLQVGLSLNQPERALPAVLSRYRFLTSLQFHCSKPEWEKQLTDEHLRCLQLTCPNLADLDMAWFDLVSDVGLASVAQCSGLTTVTLVGLSGVTGRGILSIANGCVSLNRLDVLFVNTDRVVEWLDVIGAHRQVELLRIQGCEGVGEFDLARLGRRGWGNLKHFCFSAPQRDWQSRASVLRTAQAAGKVLDWRFDDAEVTELCPNLTVLEVDTCFSLSTTGLLWVLTQCKLLQTVQIDDCFGMKDEDIHLLARNNPQLSRLDWTIPCDVSFVSLTDASLIDIGRYCRSLEMLEFNFGKGQFMPRMSESGIVAIVEGCTRLKTVSFHSVPILGERAMTVIDRSASLGRVRFVCCDDLVDEMICHIDPNLREVSLILCKRLTDTSFTRFRKNR